jgi:antirestriction protein ArdC
MPSCTRPRRPLGSKNRQPKRKARVTKRSFTRASGNTAKDVYTRVTEKILADLARGVTPWIRPWSAGNTEGRIIRPLRHNGLPYNGINVLLLWSSAIEQGFTNPKWMTFRQALELGGHVRKGEHGSLVVYAKTYTKTEPDEGGIETERNVPFLKSYTVFNTEQIDSLPDEYAAKPPPRFGTAIERLDHADTFFRNTGARIISRGGQALYSGSSDHILMPPIESFFDREGYYATLAHETIHWTKHPSRLERDFGRKRFGDAGYALEEIVAEMGSAFLCSDLEISPVVKDDHASYIASWLLALQEDNRAIVRAASFAQKAVDYLWALQPGADLTSRPDAPEEPTAPESPSTPDAGPGQTPRPGLDSPD